jgi:hypothetical protein
MKTAIFTKPLTVMLSPDDYDRIKLITDRERVSMGEWVREAVAMALKNTGEPLQ